MIYQDARCERIVGGKVSTVVEINATDKFWSEKGGRLLIIATPYRPGGHVANSPKAFVPIIEALKELHELGYVHGDIRAFNTVFGNHEHENSGCLIDFDLGGRIEKVVYPDGYRFELPDGLRNGKVGEKIHKMDDWFALGKLMFSIHLWNAHDGVGQDDENIDFFQHQRWWENIRRDPYPEEINDLIAFVHRMQGKGWTVAPSLRFETVLGAHVSQERTAVVNKSSPRASGSPE
jgi:hypothetical protein